MLTAQRMKWSTTIFYTHFGKNILKMSTSIENSRILTN
ncbi:hypothetical protein BSM4216_0871 [Bacillus smithii]|nr:hypothetical protein BSM4216_0871 [Bacillus smithii]